MNYTVLLIAAAYLLLINLVAYLAFRRDKHLAMQGHKRKRVPEARLLLYAGLGGALGAMIGMRKYHHKTHKPIFRVMVPLFLALYTLVLILAGMLLGEDRSLLRGKRGEGLDNAVEVVTEFK